MSKPTLVEHPEVVVWRIQDTAQACFDVNRYEEYVKIQSETAVRHLANSYAYDHGVYVGDGDSVQVYGNWIWNNPHGWGVQIYPGPTNARVHGNVVDSTGGGFCVSDEGSATATGNQVYNNVVLNSGGMTTQSGYFIAGAGLSGAGPVPGSNNSFTSNDAFNNPVGSAPNVAVSNNLTADPQFVDAAAHNYALGSSSPLASWGLWDGK